MKINQLARKGSAVAFVVGIFFNVQLEAQNRVALLEDFRGHKCGNCPAGDVIAQNLDDVYGKDLIVVSIHAGFLAAPNGSGNFTTDFRTTAGDAYHAFYNVSSTPIGLVNRTPYNGNDIISTGNWQSAVDQIISDSAKVVLEMNNSYNDSNRVLTINVSSTPLETIYGEYKLLLYVLEDSIVDHQTDYGSNPTFVPDYLHRHVLRDNVNGTWGTTLFSDSAAAGDTLKNNFTYTISTDWKAHHISLVAYLYNTGSNEVLNAYEWKLETSADTVSDTTSTTSIPDVQKRTMLVEIFPNPCDDHVNLRFTNMETNDLQLVIRSMDGRIVKEEILYGIQNGTGVSISSKELARGIYTLDLIGSNINLRRKFVRY